VLTRGQQGRLLQSGEQVVNQGVGVAAQLAWMNGRLVFEDASFEEVARKLERWYGLTVTLEDRAGAPPPGHLNAQFAKDQPLSDVLSVVATAFGLEHERAEPKRVTFAAAPEPSKRP
jgi:ferric-dicitrate binding protein FerR (iron transport regulator)